MKDFNFGSIIGAGQNGPDTSESLTHSATQVKISSFVDVCCENVGRKTGKKKCRCKNTRCRFIVKLLGGKKTGLFGCFVCRIPCI